ncbi:MAG TPA: hypothetical protein VFT54_09540, partial [Acidimicrobiia bacterium]|nr:hypothetical protein [Acidimicrobiia bacterium]
MAQQVELLAPAGVITSTEALEFVAELHRNFQPKRATLLEARRPRQLLIPPAPLPLRSFEVAPIPTEIAD